MEIESYKRRNVWKKERYGRRIATKRSREQHGCLFMDHSSRRLGFRVSYLGFTG